jgi:hypothetical protein
MIRLDGIRSLLRGMGRRAVRDRNFIWIRRGGRYGLVNMRGAIVFMYGGSHIVLRSRIELLGVGIVHF